MTSTEFWKLVLVAALAVPMGAWPDEVSAVKTAESRLGQSEVAIKVRGRLFDALRMHQGDTCEDASKADMGALLNEVSSLTNRSERAAIFAEFTDHLFSFDPSKLDYERQKNAIGDTWYISFLLRCAITDVTDKERWEIRLKALAWVRQQIERIENNEPEDKRTWPEKWGKVYVNENRENNQWERIKKTVRKELTSYIKRCATDIEEDKYSDEFREWAKSELETIIGRTLTDDDLWSVGIEWREERKKRTQKEGGTGINEN